MNADIFQNSELSLSSDRYHPSSTDLSGLSVVGTCDIQLLVCQMCHEVM